MSQVAANYSRFDGLNTPTQTMLKESDRLLAEHIPPGIEVKGSGGKGVATYTPWIGFFNPDDLGMKKFSHRKFCGHRRRITRNHRTRRPTRRRLDRDLADSSFQRVNSPTTSPCMRRRCIQPFH